MAKIRLYDGDCNHDKEDIARIIEENGGFVERKRNGSIWVKQSTRCGLFLSAVEFAVANSYKECFPDECRKECFPSEYKNYTSGMVREKVKRLLMDHRSTYTIDGRNEVVILNPYSGRREWLAIRHSLWEKGFFSYIDRTSGMIVVRLIKGGDTKPPVFSSKKELYDEYEKIVLSKEYRSLKN